MGLRWARAEDAHALRDAEAEIAKTPGFLVSLPHELSTESFGSKIADLRDRGCYLVAEWEGQLVGHALLEPMSLERLAHVFRLTIVIHAGYQRHGIGTLLMRELQTWARATSRVEKIELLVRASNQAAISLYRKMGFAEEGRLVRRLKLEDGTYLDDIAMAWFPRR